MGDDTSTLSEVVSSFGKQVLKTLMLPNLLAKLQNSMTALQRETNEISILEWKADRDERDAIPYQKSGKSGDPLVITSSCQKGTEMCNS